MHSRETARQKAEALFKPRAPKPNAPNPFDAIKRDAALAHSIGKIKRQDRVGLGRPSEGAGATVSAEKKRET